ncbi:7372_t:CDS:2, partial [Cetraspora pellucida]
KTRQSPTLQTGTTERKLNETIKKLPTSKATGPHGISNEILKHL